MATSCLFVLMSSSTIATSLMTLFAANCASCFAAVVLTDVDEPVSSKRRSLSNLQMRIKRINNVASEQIAFQGRYLPYLDVMTEDGRTGPNVRRYWMTMNRNLGEILTPPLPPLAPFIISRACD